MPRDLGQKVIVITGASSGIGEATALECAKARMNVVLHARRAEKLEAVAEEVRRAGAEAHSVVGDVTEDGMSLRLLDAACERFGRFDAVFANAGYGIDRPAVEVSGDELRRIFEVNFFAAVDLVNEAARRLLAEGRGGHLLMCSSCLAKFTLPHYSAYSATKAAQSHVCRAMRIELEPRAIHVSCVHPITTVTEFFAVAQEQSGRKGEVGVPGHSPGLFVQPPQRVARAVVRCLRRPRPEVWTSHTVRAVAAAVTMFPSLMDVVMRRAARSD
ncbi:MAG: SDR family NAD(P)-dependent oxidoreductase, partial [Planctomycetota bacterium]